MVVASLILVLSAAFGLTPDEEETIALAKQLHAGTEVENGHIVEISVNSPGSAKAMLARSEKLPKLKELYIDNVPLQDEDLKWIAKLHGLRRLGLEQCKIDDDKLHWLSGLTNLQELFLGANPITDKGLQHLAPLKSLRHFSASDTNITGPGLLSLGNAAALQDLYLAKTPLDDRAMDYLEKCNKLERLAVYGTKITTAGLMRLTNLHELRSLEVGDDLRRQIQRKFSDAHLASKRAARARGENVPPDSLSPFLPPGDGWPDPFEEETVALAKKLDAPMSMGNEHINMITLRSPQAVSELLPRLEKLPSLGKVKIANVPLRPDDLAKLARLTRPRSMFLENCELHNENLASLAGLTRLTFLSLNGNPITDDGLKHLSAMKGLVALHLRDTKIVGPGLLHLTNSSMLRVFSISGPLVDDRATDYLEKCKGLTTLSIDGTKITPDGLMRLAGLHELLSLTADSDLARIAGRRFQEAHVDAKQAARARGERVPRDDLSPLPTPKSTTGQDGAKADAPVDKIRPTRRWRLD